MMMKTFLGVLVMFLVPLFFGWLPFAGLLAGLVGGYLIGSPLRSMKLALGVFGALSLAILLASIGVGLPLIGAAVAGVAFLWLTFHSVLMLLGAFAGGVASQLTGASDGRPRLRGSSYDLLR
jgi:hypothetical protein